MGAGLLSIPPPIFREHFLANILLEKITRGSYAILGSNEEYKKDAGVEKGSKKAGERTGVRQPPWRG